MLGGTVEQKGKARCFAFVVIFFGSTLLEMPLIHADDSEKKKPFKQIEIKSIQNEYIVKFKKHAGITAAQQVHKASYELSDSLDLNEGVSIQSLETNKHVAKVEFKTGTKNISNLIAELRNSEEIESLEPNVIYSINEGAPQQIIPNDSMFPLSWPLLNTGQDDSEGQPGFEGKDIGITRAWLKTKGSKKIIVAVLDSGVDYNHEDLKDNMWVNAGEIPDNGVDDDGNGFIDDVHGWNFEKRNNDPSDDNSHGTHCAGIIGALGNNKTGTTGVNWDVTIMPIKFISSEGKGPLEKALEAVNYAVKMGANVISNSWGSYWNSSTLEDAIKAANEKGVLFVTSAGNEGMDNDARAYYPASYSQPNLIAVAATDNRDVRATWSNYGQKKVHLAAPGVNVLSTLPVKLGKYGTASGTSMAAPFVAGAAALLLATNPKFTPAELKKRMMDTVDYVRPLLRKTVSAGRLNIYNALNEIIPERIMPDDKKWKSAVARVESAHPYLDFGVDAYQIVHPGAKFLRVHFKKIGTEQDFDFIRILEKSGIEVETISGELTNIYSDYIEGDKVTLIFASDRSVNGYGFAVDRYEFIE